MTFLAELLVSALLVIGGVFVLIGSFGLFKLNDLMRRLHAPTKATTVGVGGVLIASMAYFALFEGRITVHELLVTLFLFLTAPITANMIAKAYLHVIGEDAARLPPTSTEEGWATFDAAPTIEQTESAARPDS
jgi:multicomponent K+:H+ antiporter subunit G